MTGQVSHWDGVYGRKAESEMSWHEAVPDLSLKLVRAHAPARGSIIDIGGGTSRLTEVLQSEGYRPLAVLDISRAALDANRRRIGPAGELIQWIAADIVSWQPDRAWDIWHDRAVFHFLTDPADQRAYVARMDQALKPDGVAILATFAKDGPERCSGLPVQRYDPQDLASRLQALAPGRFAPVHALYHTHMTPSGGQQPFQYSVFRKIG